MGLSLILRRFLGQTRDRWSTIAGELVVVDGNGVLFHLWTNDDDRRLCGGDYRTFVRRLQDFVLSLVSAGVKPFFVFDGSTRAFVPLQEMKADSVLARILPSMHLSLVAASLRPLNVPYFVALTAADPIVAYLSRRLGALVITSDSDIVCRGVRTAFNDGPAFCSKRATLELPVRGLDGSEIADTFGLTVPHIGFMNIFGSPTVFPPENIVAAGNPTSNPESRSSLTADMAKEGWQCAAVIPSNPMRDIPEFVSEHVALANVRRPIFLRITFELVKILGVRRDDDLRRQALALSGEELVRLWTRVCADAEKDLMLLPGLEGLLSLPRPVFAALRENGTALRQLVPAFRYDNWEVGGSFQFDHKPEPCTAGFVVLDACQRAVAALCAPRASRCKKRGKKPELLARLPNIFEESVSDLVRLNRSLTMFYKVTGLASRRRHLSGFPGWRRTLAVCFVLWRKNRQFDIPEVFLQAAVLTHMHLSDMIELPGVAEDLKLGRQAFASNRDNNFKSIMEASAFATYEALKAVATWLDTLLTLLGNPLPPVRPERLFSGPVYLKALELLAAKPLSELASERGFASKLGGTLAEDYFCAVMAVCSETRPVPEDAKWHGNLIRTGCKRVLDVHVQDSRWVPAEFVVGSSCQSGGDRGSFGRWFTSKAELKKYVDLWKLLELGRDKARHMTVKQRRATLLNLDQRRLRLCFMTARVLDAEEKLSGSDFEKNPERRAACLRRLEKLGVTALSEKMGPRELPEGNGGRVQEEVKKRVKVKSTCRRKWLPNPKSHIFFSR